MTVGLKLRDNQEKIMIIILIKIMIIQITLLINIRTSNTLSEKLSKINKKKKNEIFRIYKNQFNYNGLLTRH